MRIITTLLAVFLTALTISAQTNPRSGYIVTNSGDTIRGTIQYRTDDINCRECSFLDPSATEYESFTPDDIRSYQFDNGGKYYISKRVPLSGKITRTFVEYVADGALKVYYYSGRAGMIYFVENEKGQIASYNLNAINEGLSAAERNRQLNPIRSVLAASQRALAQVSINGMNRNTWARIAQLYNEDVTGQAAGATVSNAESNGTAPVAQPSTVKYYGTNSSNDAPKMHFDVAAGIGSYTMDYGNLTAPQISLGVSTEMARMSEGLYFDLLATYGHGSRDIEGMEEETYMQESNGIMHNVHNRDQFAGSEKNNYINVSLGAHKQLGQGRVVPVVRGGFHVLSMLGCRHTSGVITITDTYIEDKKQIVLNTSKPYEDEHINNKYLGLGVYVGTGVDIRLGSSILGIHAEWRPYFYDNIKSSFTAGISLKL